MTAGEYRSGNAQQEKPRFFQSTLLHGLPAGWTIDGGMNWQIVIVLLISVLEKHGGTGRSVCGYDAG
ncbi:fimbria/pilus outer membrane usher protein [Escherichia coli]